MGRTNTPTKAHRYRLAAVASILITICVSPLLISLTASATEADSDAAGTRAGFEEGAWMLRRCAGEPRNQCDFEAAIKAIERADALDPTGRPEVLDLYAQALLAAGPSHAKKSLAVLQRLAEADPKNANLEYFRGLARYRLEDWAGAVNDLNAALGRGHDSAELHLLLGVANAELAVVSPALAAQHGDDPKFDAARTSASAHADAAKEHFKTAISKDPRLQDRVWYRLGLLALAEKRTHEARDHLEAVDHSKLVGSAKKYLDLIDRRERKERGWGVYVSLGGGYDSNVTLTNETSLTSGTSAGLGLVELGGSYNLYDKGRYRLKVGQFGYANFHSALTDLDLAISETSLNARARLTKWAAAELGYAFQFAGVDWNSYRSTHAVEPAFVLTLGGSEGIHARPYFRFERRDYYADVGVLDDSLHRDGKVYATGVDLYRAMSWFERWGSSWVRVGYKFRKESARSDEFDSVAHEPIVAVGLPLPLDFALTFEGRYQWRDYDSTSFFDAPGSSDHSDRIATFASSVRWKFDRHVSAKIIYSYTDRDSNVEVYRYERNQVQLQLKYDF